MESTRLVQRRFLSRITVDILDKGIAVSERIMFNPRKYKVRFENISAEGEEVSNSSQLRFWATIILFALALLTGLLQLFGQDVGGWAFLIWVVLGIITGVSYLMSRETFLVYGAVRPQLIVYKNKPNVGAFTAFMAEVQRRKQDYILNNYLLNTAVGSSADAIHKLAWLKNEGAINDTEFELLKAEIVGNARWGGTAATLPHSTN
jgi:hypothetical protein